MQASVHVYKTHHQASVAAAGAVATEMRRLIAERGRAIGIFSGETSQIELLAHLVKAEDIQWTKVVGFHTFELLGVSESAANSQRKFLLDHLVCQVPMAEFHGLRGEAANPEAVCANYSELLTRCPPDFALLTIAQNGDLAALGSGDFDPLDSAAVKLTESAIALTIRTLMACRSLFVLIETRNETLSTSILRTHPNVSFYGVL